MSSASSRGSSKKSSQNSEPKSSKSQGSYYKRSNAQRNSKSEETDWFQLAYFNTKFDLRNSVKTSDQGFERGSIMITVEKPRFYLQPGSIDSAILFWLNYKSTYEYWLQQRQQISSFLVDQDNEVLLSSPSGNSPEKNMKTAPPEEDIKSVNNFLALKLR